MMSPKITPRPLSEILFDIANLGPFLPGSVRKGGVQRHRNKKGEMIAYKTQPLFNYSDGTRRIDKRIPSAMYNQVKDLTENYKRFKALILEIERLQVYQWVEETKKKKRL